MKVIHEQTNRLEKIDDRWFDILDAAAEMPTVQLRARQAEAAIQQLKNQNELLNDHIKNPQEELAARPTLAIVNPILHGGRVFYPPTPPGR